MAGARGHRARFSVVETLGASPRRAALAASVATFTVGALVGGVVTFAGVALLGSRVVGDPGWPAIGALAGVALAGAVAEACGVRIVRRSAARSRRPWRRMPLPVAAGAYGVLLGLGFTTFVLTFAFWGLVLALLVLGDPQLGLAVGLAFGTGRALPVAALAPFASCRRGRRLSMRWLSARPCCEPSAWCS